MRKLLSLFVVVFVLLVGVTPVQAQGILRGGYMPSSWEGWYYYFRGDQVHMLQADMVNWVGETMRIGHRANIRYLADDLVSYGPHIGLNGSRGFYPMYQCSKGQRWEKGIGRTVMAGVAGYVGAKIAGGSGKEGAIVGAIGGAGYSVYKDANCAPVQNQMVVIDDPSDLAGAPRSGGPTPSQMSPSRENGWNQRLRDQANAGGNSWFGSYRGCLDQGMFTLKNETGEVILVFQNGQPYASLLPMESECGDPFASYDAVMVVAGADNYMAVAGMPRAKPEGRKGGVWVWR